MAKKITKVSEISAICTPVPAIPTVQPTSKVELTQAEKIWNEISGVKLDMFALPKQLVSTYYKPLFADPNKLLLVPLTKASSALQALETEIGSKYVVELSEKYVVVSLKSVV